MRFKKTLVTLHLFLAVSLLVAFTPPAVSTRATAAADDSEVPRYSPELDHLRQQMAASGVTNVALAKAEYFTTADGYNAATSQTLIANDRTHLIDSQFVENDPRRGGQSFITYVVDQSDGSATTNPPAILPNSVTEAAIDQSMATWAAVGCNGPGVVKVADSGGNIDLIDDLVLGGPIGSPTADITHAGWLPAPFFNAIAPPNGATFILGVTFTFIFVDPSFNPTDIDHNGLADVAFREIYYNRSFPWATNGSSNNIDIQSVATHEAGHGFGLGHFGKVFVTKKDPVTVANLKYAPRAVMNAVYASPFRELTGTDNGPFCHIWANSH